ncbi:MAG: trans-sulfuration enzyme family protein [Phycisphaerales bacterium JB039]
MPGNTHQPATRVVHLTAADQTTGAIAPPLHLSTTFERDADGGYPRGFTYARPANPTRALLEQTIAALEGAGAAACFSSGSAATAAIFGALAPGDHVVAPQEAYYGTPTQLTGWFARWGLRCTLVDTSDPGAIAGAMTGQTRMLWLESPSNPRLRICDIEAACDVARRHGALVVCDNTVATPLLQHPLALGADAVVHSTTKYISGHGDTLGGAVALRDPGGELAGRIFEQQAQLGAVPSPFECWLTLRGMRTLALRLRAHCENARRVAEFLSGHPAVTATHYPGLPTHPGHAVAARQMRDFGGLLSFEVAGGRPGAFAVIARLGLIRRATSLGSVESLAQHRASQEGPDTRSPEGLIRMSVGIEDPGDLIADLRQALEAAP